MLRPAIALPDPDTLTGADVVIYDGHCKFCSAGVSRLRQLDLTGNRLSFISLHDPRVAERYPDLTHDQLMEQMYVIDGQGNRHAGADAVRHLSRRLPLLRIAAPLLHIPGYRATLALDVPTGREAALQARRNDVRRERLSHSPEVVEDREVEKNAVGGTVSSFGRPGLLQLNHFQLNHSTAFRKMTIPSPNSGCSIRRVQAGC